MTRRCHSSRHLLLRYLAVGAICAIGQNAVIIGGDLLGYHYLLTASAGAVIFGALGYALHSRVTYGEPLSWRGSGRFAMSLVSGYILSIALLALMGDLLAIPMIITSPTTTIIVTIWGFIASRWAILWRRKSSFTL